MELIVKGLEDLPNAATVFLNEISYQKVITFEGEMGAGKTTFILQILKSLGVTDAEGSPTYSVVNEYDSPAFGKIYHLDLFRLEDAQEALDIGIEEMLYDGAYCFIEWPDKIDSMLPENVINVQIENINQKERRIAINF